MTDTTSAPESEEAPEPSADTPATLAEETDEEQGFSPSSWEIIAGVVLLVAAIVIIVVLTGSDDGDDTTTAGSTPAPAVSTPAGGTIPPGATFAPPTTALPEATPTTPLATTELAADTFDRANAESLGKADSGQTWVSEMGTWGIKGNAAHVAQPREEGFRQVALLDTEAVYMNQGSVTVDFKNAAPGAGIVFRYNNPFNYYAIVAQPGGANWRIEQIVGGETTNIGVVQAPSEGAVSMTVQLRGFFFDFYQDDRVVGSVKGEALPLAGGVGLYATSAAIEEGLWDTITVGESDTQLENLPARPDAPAAGGPAAGGPATTAKP